MGAENREQIDRLSTGQFLAGASSVQRPYLDAPVERPSRFRGVVRDRLHQPAAVGAQAAGFHPVLDQPEVDRGGTSLREVEIIGGASLAVGVADELHAKRRVALSVASSSCRIGSLVGSGLSWSVAKLM